MMHKLYFLVAALLTTASLSAQLITTDPAAPTDDQAVTITFDATQGTGGLKDCGCDVYLHTGVITDISGGEWKYVATVWGQANDAWKLTPVAGEANKYTYTYTPTLREYFGVPAGEEIEQLALVFRNADGSLEGKASGGADIFVDVSQGGGVLGLTVAGDPERDSWPLGKPLPIVAGTTTDALIQVFDNDVLVATATGTELVADVVFTTPGPHTVRIVGTAGEQVITEEFTLDAELVVEFTSFAADIISASPGETVTFSGTSYIAADLSISDGTGEVFSATNTATFSEDLALANGAVTTYTVTARYLDQTATDRVTFVTGPAEVAAPPGGLRPGAVNRSNGDVTLQLRAPGKSDVFVIGNFNDWTPTAASRMKRAGNDTTFWLTLTDLAPEEDLLYQYLVDGTIRQPDPYSTLVLDPFNDPAVAASTFPAIPDYPDAASGIVSWHRRGVPAYPWKTGAEYQRPDPQKMVVYELLVRDFLADHSFRSLTDTLDYLERLGVNTIELLPVSEFENNNSWGYNVSYHMALDKYYGSPEDLKALVDECHQRGMAVVLDVVYNHAFGQSALARLWWDDDAFRPTPDNPYLNVEAKHPFNVGYDFNHDSPLTKEYVKTTLRYWIEEFRVDGFRFDLSKGFTQNFSADVSAWNRYDADRVAIIKDYADFVWSVDPDTYMIMEHLAELREESELARYGNGMYFWTGGGLHNQYLEASMGYPSNLRGALATNNGFTGLYQMGYMESHDEERMQVKNEKFGNSAGNYDVTDQNTGLERVELASTFFYTVPGPKMLWQFGELGYDFAINYCQNGSEQERCRTDPKPIRWDYRNDPNRQDIYDWIADLLYLRNNYDFFHGDVLRQDLGQPVKVMHLSGMDGDAVVVGNFGVVPGTATNPFPATGTWYDYEGDETITVSDLTAELPLGPGKFKLFLSQRIQRNPDNNIGTSANDVAVARLRFELSPNPTAGEVRLDFHLARAGRVTVDLLDVSGRKVGRMYAGARSAGQQGLSLRANVAPGLYFVRIAEEGGSAVRRLVVR